MLLRNVYLQIFFAVALKRKTETSAELSSTCITRIVPISPFIC